MGYRPQASQQGGYGQPELRPGVPVTSADGQWKGTVVEVLPAGRGYEGTVRVQWEGYGLTYVTLGMLGYDNGRFVVRSDGGQAAQAGQAGQGGQQGQNLAGTNAASATDVAAISDRIEAERPANAPDDLTLLPSTPRPQQREQTTPAYIPPSPRDDDATRYNPPTPAPAPAQMYNPSPVERMDADEMTRLPQSDRQAPAPPTPQPFTQPAYPAPQEATRPASPYYPEAPPLPEHAEQRAVAEPAYVMEPAQAEITVPIIEEQLTAQPEWRDAGNITVRTQTEEVPQSFTQQVEREEAFVERVPVGRALADGETPAPRQEGDTFIMPVIVEEAVVVVRRVLAEEVRVTKRMVRSSQTVETTLRRQRADIDAGTLGDRVHEERRGS